LRDPLSARGSARSYGKPVILVEELYTHEEEEEKREVPGV